MKWLTGWIGNRRAKLLNDLGNERRQAGDLVAAAEAYRGAVVAAPESPAALYNLGTCLRELKRAPDAERHLRKLAAIAPADADGLFQLGELLYEDGRLTEAVGILQRAFELAPRNSLLAFYIGIALMRTGNPTAAADALRQAIAIETDFPDAQINLGNALGMAGRHEEALLHYREASRLRPDNPVYSGALLNEMQHACDWDGMPALIERQRRSLELQPEAPIHPFHLLSLPSTRAEQLQCARNYSAHVVRAYAAAGQNGETRRTGAERIRIGYLSADFHEHATAYLIAEMLELHDRRRFEIAAYSWGPDTAGAMQSRLRGALERFVDVRALSGAQAASAIREHGVDILVDLKGYTQDARSDIVALRPAPIQVSYLGFPGTMGAPFIDYFIADRFTVPPGHEADYSEKLVFMPGCYQVNDRKRAAAAAPAREALGLPVQGFVFCAFHQSYKILPEVFAAWMRLLQAVPGSVLWLLESNPLAVANLRREAQRAGIGAGRLVFAPKLAQDAHLARLAAADLYLDTFPCNAHTTASDALWAGLPVITCAGETFASRVAGSLLHAVGLPELVTASLPDYESLAQRLAASPAELRGLRERLKTSLHSTALYDTPRFVRHLEAAYEQMWSDHQAGRPAGHITPG
jgi:protein O-GlcNAc transferase